MKDKYYTPTIEEFHVGFEFEVNYTDEGWVKEIFCSGKGRNIDSVSKLKAFLGSAKFEEAYRVKYLDREDIESLGFVGRNPERNNKSSDYFKMKAPGTISYWTEIDLDFRWGFKDVSIRGVRGNEDDYLFRGTIKNKSELKKLLKMLNIL